MERHAAVSSPDSRFLPFAAFCAVPRQAKCDHTRGKPNLFKPFIGSDRKHSCAPHHKTQRVPAAENVSGPGVHEGRIDSSRGIAAQRRCPRSGQANGESPGRGDRSHLIADIFCRPFRAPFLRRPLPRAALRLPGATVSSPSRAGIEGISSGARVLRQSRRPGSPEHRLPESWARSLPALAGIERQQSTCSRAGESFFVSSGHGRQPVHLPQSAASARHEHISRKPRTPPLHFDGPAGCCDSGSNEPRRSRKAQGLRSGLSCWTLSGS